MPPQPLVEARILVYGRVQGVFYRAGIKQQAAALGLTGWARNLPDGRVEILAQGARPQLAELIRGCYNVSRAAQVERVAADFREPKEICHNFIIK